MVGGGEGRGAWGRVIGLPGVGLRVGVGAGGGVVGWCVGVVNGSLVAMEQALGWSLFLLRFGLQNGLAFFALWQSTSARYAC